MRRERSRSTGAVVRPSTACPISARAASGVAPRAISSPARRLRPLRMEAAHDQVAHPREPRERLGLCAECFTEARHLDEPACDQRRLRVVAEPEAVDAACGQRDHVLRCAAELHTDDVVVHVDAESDGVERVLQPERQAFVLRRDHGRTRQPGEHLLRHVGAGEHGDRAIVRRASRDARPSPGRGPSRARGSARRRRRARARC